MTQRGRENFEGFVYLDIHQHPMVAWNTARGVFCSSDCLGTDIQQSVISISMTNMLRGYSWDRLNSELAIEAVRQAFYSGQVSRLRGIFVFDEVESVSRLWYGGGWGEHFHDKYLTDVGVAANRSSRLDANWVTEIFNENFILYDDWFDKANKYWRGEPHPTKEPIWERIVEGWATIWGREIKIAAFKEIESYWPKSIKLLEYSCIAASLGTNDGIIYSLGHQEDEFLNIAFYIRLVDAKDSSTFTRMETLFREYPELRAVLPGEPFLVTPDLSHLTIKIPADRLKQNIFSKHNLRP